MIRFFIFTFLLNMSLLDVNSSDNNKDDIPSFHEEKEEEEDKEENVDEEKENVDKDNEGENKKKEMKEGKLSKSINSRKIEEDVDLIDDSFDDKSNINKEINNNKNINSFIGDNSNNEKENINEGNIFIPDLNISEIQGDINKNDNKESDIYDKIDIINKFKFKKGIINDKTDLSGLGKKKRSNRRGSELL